MSPTSQLKMRSTSFCRNPVEFGVTTSVHLEFKLMIFQRSVFDGYRFAIIHTIFALAESLGGYESLIEIPSIMTHTSVPYAVRMENGIFDNMIRLSVGLEDSKDLSRALYESLDAITSTAA
ncbi:hypothetical protein AHF37_06209 [Paragonimus kellicotti]|nr:hypothetical protein AHF37_06209 [Paragonimus kellicotti]